MGVKRKIRRGLERDSKDPKLRLLSKSIAASRADALAAIRSDIGEYADSWLENAGFLEKNGVYRQIADFAGFKEGEWWLDLGSGYGNLISEVCRRVETTAIGIDINTHLLEKSRERLVQEGLDVNYNASYEIMEDPKLGFRLVPREREGFQIKEGSPNIILDDIRFLNIVTRHLPEQKPDKIIYTLPGGYISFLYEFIPKLTRDSYSIFMTMNKFIASHACRLLGEGREFIIAARISVLEEAKDGDAFGFPRVGPYLEVKEEDYLDYPKEAERLNKINGAIKIIDPTSPYEKRSIKLFLRKYRRTSVPFPYGKLLT